MGKDVGRSLEQDGASPGKIFIGGLPKETTTKTFLEHFGKYGKIIDSVIMKHKITKQPRGFGFVTYADPSVVDIVIEEPHVINGKQVEIKRTIPKGTVQSKDFKTKKIFVGGIPLNVTEDEFKEFFSEYGKVVDHQIVRDHTTKRSRGFGFIVFDDDRVVDDLLVNGNMIELAGTQVEIKKAEPKKPSIPSPAPFSSESRGHSLGDGFGGFDRFYSGYGGSGFNPALYRTYEGFGSRLGGYGSYGGVAGSGSYGGAAGEFGSNYGGFGDGLGVGGFSRYRGESSHGYSSRLGSYGGGYGGGYTSGGFGGYGRDEGFESYGGGYDFGSGAGYGSGGPPTRGSYGGGAGRYHPYAR